MSDPVTKSVMTGNLAVLQMAFNKGDSNQGHKHSYNHLTLVASGSVSIETKKSKEICPAGTMIWIDKDKEHKMTALEDNTVVYCIHALHSKHSPDEILEDAHIPGRTPHPVEYVSLLQKLDEPTVTKPKNTKKK